MNKNKLIHLLYQATRGISQGVNQVLADYGLYSSEWSIIVALIKSGPISQISLANYLNIEPSAISKTVIKLEEKGFIERKSERDRREKKVFLTDKALSQYPEWEEAIEKHRQALLANLSEEKQQELMETLNAIYINSQEYKK